jgi:hypothetical protein
MAGARVPRHPRDRVLTLTLVLGIVPSIILESTKLGVDQIVQRLGVG